jgi:hypothetical protein
MNMEGKKKKMLALLLGATVAVANGAKTHHGSQHHRGTKMAQNKAEGIDFNSIENRLNGAFGGFTAPS